jgi:hypothetical protein
MKRQGPESRRLPGKVRGIEKRDEPIRSPLKQDLLPYILILMFTSNSNDILGVMSQLQRSMPKKHVEIDSKARQNRILG